MLPTEFKKSEGQSEFQTNTTSWADEVDKEERAGKIKVSFSRSLSSSLNAPHKVPNKTSLKANLEKLIIDKIVRLVDVDSRHTKALFLNVNFEGVRLGKVLVEITTIVNIMPLYVFKKLGKIRRDLHNKQTNITSFSGLSEKVKGMVIIKIRVGTKTTFTRFFI